MPPLALDVIIPTYNRAELLPKAVESVLSGGQAGLQVTVIVVDNNSQDNTKQVAEAVMAAYPGRVRYLFEGRQGRSFALNTGIRSATGELIAMIDDDEEVARNWVEDIASWVSDPTIDFLGGPICTLWSPDVRLPGWISDCSPVIWSPPPESATPMPFPRSIVLMGGNALVRRRVFESVGLYAEDLGRRGARLLSCEDHEMTIGLLNAGKRGFFVPALRVYHRIHAEHLTKRYHRRWIFEHAISNFIMDSRYRPEVPFVGRIPRWKLGEAVRSIPRLLVAPNAAERFKAELRIWALMGYVRAAYFTRHRTAKPAGVSAATPPE